MKKFAYIILSIVVVSVLAGSSALAEPKKAEKAEANQASTKITRDAAEQLVMKKYLGVKVISCALNKDNSAWIVRFNRTGGNLAETVMVDAQTGKVTR